MARKNKSPLDGLSLTKQGMVLFAVAVENMLKDAPAGVLIFVCASVLAWRIKTTSPARQKQLRADTINTLDRLLKLKTKP